MIEPIKRGGTWLLGWTLIVLGLLGLVLPILQGILFLCLGVLILSRHSETVRRAVARLREKYPAMAKAFDRAEARVRGMGGDGGASRE